ncbi:ferredoxin [Desulfitobacterium sp. THU1]|uniref:ferredoxin n=1 Tax=Desulfitobacterium sp. THU1 TaxID=3138072 RepID=UPI00311D3D32
MIAKVNRESCIGCGACESVCPKVFQMDEEGLAIVIATPVPQDEEAGAQEAADGCPVEAITLE